jgi:hypothetical protein
MRASLNSVIFSNIRVLIRGGRVGKRNKYQARKSLTKVSCRISSLRTVAEEVEGPCETQKNRGSCLPLGWTLVLTCVCTWAIPASSLTEPRMIQGQWLGWDLSAAQIGTRSNGAAYPQPTKTPAAPLRRQPNQLRRLIAKSLPNLTIYWSSIRKVNQTEMKQ